MSKRGEKPDHRQGEFILASDAEIIPSAPVVTGLSVMARVQQVMKARRISRGQLADYLTQRRGRVVTTTTIDTWFAETKPWHWPDFPTLVLICQFIDDTSPMTEMLKPLGEKNIGPRGIKLLNMGANYLDKRRLEIEQDNLDRAVNSILIEDLKNGNQRRRI